MTVAAAAVNVLFSGAPFSICCVVCAACGPAEGTGTSSYSINDRLFCTWCSAKPGSVICVDQQTWQACLTTVCTLDGVQTCSGSPLFPGSLTIQYWIGQKIFSS